MTRTKGQDGSDHARLSSDERSQLRSAERLAASFRRRGGGESQCGCGGGGPGIHRRPFLLFLEREEEEKWRVVRAYPLPNSKEVVHTRTPALPETFGVEPLLVIHLEGEIVTASSYAGCAYCLDGTVFR